uniref:Minor capsid protein n=1 Tax=Gokushovirinae environmental samples TaxID=1478972 RepID=A0A2R3UAA2_9VIRU|nr:minor capsid protein [Gokushovirinae environmental samples]
MWEALIPLVTSAFSGLMSQEGQEDTNWMNYNIMKENNAFNADQAQVNRDFQERMRGSQYQTTVKDMAAAGLNPMLSYHMGGAGTPGGSAASASGNAQMHSSVGAGLSSAAEAGGAASEFLKRDAERRYEEQSIKLREPVEKIADVASKGVDAVKEVVKPLSEKVSEIVMTVEDKLKSGSLTSAVADRVENIVEKAKDLATDVASKVMAPYKALATNTSSAGQAVRRGMQAIHGSPGVKVPESKGKVPREAQGRIRRHEWKFNYTP